MGPRRRDPKRHHGEDLPGLRRHGEPAEALGRHVVQPAASGRSVAQPAVGPAGQLHPDAEKQDPALQQTALLTFKLHFHIASFLYLTSDCFVYHIEMNSYILVL